MAGKGSGQPFVERVRSLVAGGPLQEVAEALLSAWRAINGQISVLSRRLIVVARQDQAVKRLMTAPGVGILVGVDLRQRHRRSAAFREVVQRWRLRRPDAAALPVRGGRLHRHISKHGDALLCTYLFEAAGIILHWVAKWSALKAWGTRLVKRIGAKKATVAVARKLAGILHRMCKDDSEFRWSAQDAKAA